MKPHPEPSCPHHFFLGDSRTGSEAVGTCIYCGTSKAFANTLGGAMIKGIERSTLLTSLINQGRAVHEVPFWGPNLGQASESFKKGRG